MTRFKKTVFELKNSAFRPGAVRYYRELKQNQFLDADALRRLNWLKRRELVTFAFENIPFYRGVYAEAGLTRDALQSKDNFIRIPIVSKEDLRLRYDQFVAPGVSSRDCNKSTTGGSTGIPISVLHDRRLYLEAASWRMLRWWDVEPSDDMAIAYRLRRRFPQNILNALMWWPTRRIFLDASRMTTAGMRDFVKRYRALQPNVLIGYVGAVHELALFLLENEMTVPSPKAIWVTSAPLSESQRVLIQKAFHAPVYDQYGSCEVMWLASECQERNGLHINYDIRYLEFVDDDGMPVPEGEWGKILVTDLENRVFPIIRYEIGDVGRRLTRPCSCGVNLPLMDKVRGRISDVLRLANGMNISGEFLTTIFDEYPDAVDAFQVCQKKDLSIVLRCVSGRAKNAESSIAHVLNTLRKRVGDSVPVTLDMVSHIPHNRGKTQFIISEVGHSEVGHNED